MTPMPQSKMVERMTLMTMLVAKQAGLSSQDISKRLHMYALHMAEWPADIFLAVILHAEKTCTFWPSFSELNKTYELWIERRQNMLKALQNYRI